MARVFVTGSADGLGLAAARSLLENGHEVVLHARNPTRAENARRRLAAAKAVVVGDLASLAQTRGVAEQANRLGPFDAVIHNAGVGAVNTPSRRQPRRSVPPAWTRPWL